MIHKGMFLYVDYADECPEQCRTHTYSTIVITKDQSKNIEYSTSVGNGLFPAYFHKGIRLTINPLKTPCKYIKKCIVTVRMNKPSTDIGVNRQGSIIRFIVNKQYWYFYTKRSE